MNIIEMAMAAKMAGGNGGGGSGSSDGKHFGPDGVILRDSLPEGYPYKEQSETVLFNHQFSNNDFFWENSIQGYVTDFVEGNEPLIVGEKYTVTVGSVVFANVVATDSYGTNVNLTIDKQYSPDVSGEFLITSVGKTYAIGLSGFVYNGEEEFHIYDNPVVISKKSETIHTMAPEFLPEGYPSKEEKTVFEFSLDPDVMVDDQPVPDGYTKKQTNMAQWTYTANAEDVGLSSVVGNIGALIGATVIYSNGNEATITSDDVANGEYYVPDSGSGGIKITNAGVVEVYVYGSAGSYTPEAWPCSIKMVTVTPMAPEFLPAGVGGGGMVVKLVIPEEGAPVPDKTHEEIKAALLAGNRVEIHQSIYDMPGVVSVYHAAGIAPDDDKPISFYCVEPIHSHSPSDAIVFNVLRIHDDDSLDMIRYSIAATYA